jgi:hypothetical protein
MRSVFLLLSLLFLTSCSIYRKQFDGPADPGVPCTSVTDLEQMVIETEKGQDIFLSHTTEPCTTRVRRKIWVNDYQTPNGNWIPGHYVYIN